MELREARLAAERLHAGLRPYRLRESVSDFPTEALVPGTGLLFEDEQAVGACPSSCRRTQTSARRSGTGSTSSIRFAGPRRTSPATRTSLWGGSERYRATCATVDVVAHTGSTQSQGAASCLVRHRQRGVELLTCTHVIKAWDGSLADTTLTVEEPTPATNATLRHAVPINGPNAEDLDAALIVPEEGDLRSWTNGYLDLPGLADPEDVQVAKLPVDLCGPVTEANGTVYESNFGPVSVDMSHLGGAPATLANMIIVRTGTPTVSFSDQGDSGSAVTADGKGVGMVTATARSNHPAGPATLISSLSGTLERLDCELLM